MWTCPHCRNPLLPDAERSLACCSGHRFDLAREGHVNLLPVSRKRSKNPGDSSEMIAARSRVHEANLYQPLAQAMMEELATVVRQPVTALDLGCGEGYYSLALTEAFADARVYGVDIAKNAVRLAARRCRAGQFAVASAFDVPLADGSLDLVQSVFAPVDEAELRRLLRPGGIYLKVVPAPRHLWELRCLLYDEPRPHEEALSAPQGFELLKRQALDYRLTLESDSLRDLVSMTPYAHKGQREHRGRLDELEKLSLQMAFSIAVMRYCPQ
jgi:23S rRNA (guanine745-N1)-methyltransferase